MQRLLRKLAVLFSPILLLVTAVNWAGDPARVFQHGEYEERIAAALAGGRNVTGPADFDDRLMRKRFVELTASLPEVLILGSSRVMTFQQAWFDRSIHNGGVSAATLEDVRSVRHACPRAVILVGSGVTIANARSFLPLADGFIVGTSLKRGGRVSANDGLIQPYVEVPTSPV